MGQLTDAGASLIYRYLLEGYTEPSVTPGTWFTLFTDGPTHDGTYTELPDFPRIQLPTWTYGGSWPSLTATLGGSAIIVDPMNACTVTGWGLFSDDTAGTLMWFEVLGTPDNYADGDRFVLPAGSIVVNLNT